MRCVTRRNTVSLASSGVGVENCSLNQYVNTYLTDIFHSLTCGREQAREVLASCVVHLG